MWRRERRLFPRTGRATPGSEPNRFLAESESRDRYRATASHQLRSVYAFTYETREVDLIPKTGTTVEGPSHRVSRQPKWRRSDAPPGQPPASSRAKIHDIPQLRTGHMSPPNLTSLPGSGPAFQFTRSGYLNYSGFITKLRAFIVCFILWDSYFQRQVL